METGVSAGIVQADEGEEPGHLRFGGHQVVKEGGEPFGLVDEVGAGGPIGGGEVALVE